MTIARFAYLGCSAATAASGFVAAVYWYLSSRPAPQAAAPPMASISDIQAALYEASRLNKKASIWSAAAAFLGGLTFAFGLIA